MTAVDAISTTPGTALRVHPNDNVAVVLTPYEVLDTAHIGSLSVRVLDVIPPGHKVALRDIGAGEVVRKYGYAIGVASCNIEAGQWVHEHNLVTQLSGDSAIAASITHAPPAPTWSGAIPTFEGYRRADGRIGTRNEVWVINTVGCVNTAAERIARVAAERFGGQVDGIHAFAHPYGCSQLGDDLRHTQAVLGGLLGNPNVGGALVLGLGCENNQLPSFLRAAAPADPKRIRSFNTQDVTDEIEAGVAAIGELIERMHNDRRETVPASALVLGHKCGGSDGFSGLSANPLLGRVADRLTAMGGTVLLTEVPEMFGAERVLLERAQNEEVQSNVAAMIDGFKQYFVRHNQPVYENPSPGNKAGGLTTLEEKSLGAIQKGGQATVTGVLRYGERAPAGGLRLLEAPGNDGVSSTALVASGATMLLFTTGRGTPLGFPVPTIKVSSNSDIAMRKPHWIDFDAGRLLSGHSSMDAVTDELFALILDIASGRKLARNEEHGYREIAIWKHGVTL